MTMGESTLSPGPKSVSFRLLAAIGPGIFIIGYIIGTGSVTSMAKAGAEYGMTLTWALALSCFCTYVAIVAVSRVTIISGQTLLRCIRQRFGSALAFFIIAGLMATVVASVIGVMGIATDVVQVWSSQVVGGMGFSPLITALVLNGILCFLIWRGSHGFFLRAMAMIVALMGVSFIATMFLVIPGPVELIQSLKPALPAQSQAHLVLAAMVGTTMASVCVVTRSYLVAERGWGLKDLKLENRDAIVSLSLTFLVSAAIMASAAGTMLPAGIPVVHAIDMVKTLEPLAGPFATALFVTGIVAAALSSLFPNYVLGPWLVCDFLDVPRQMDRNSVRLAVVGAAALSFIVPVFGGRPVFIMIASQAISTIVMPLLIVLLLIMLNSAKTVGDYKNSMALNLGLIVTLAFAFLVSYSGALGLFDSIRDVLFTPQA
jgi:Mn2+/Fe2+ NRAMP family transporter